MTTRGGSDWSTLTGAWRSLLDGSGLAGIVQPSAAADALGGAAAGYAAFAETIGGLARDRTASGDLAARLAALLRGEHAPGTAGAKLRAALKAVPPGLFGGAGATAFGAAERENLDTMMGWAEEWLELPLFGPQREWLDAIRQAQRALIAEQRAAHRLAAGYDAVFARALERFAAFLEDESDAVVTSVRGLYDVWIDTAEAEHQQAVMDDDFAEDFATWVNAGSATRLRLRALTARVSTLIGIPVREEFHTVLARERALREQVESLRREVADLRALRAPAPEASVGDPSKPRAPRAAAAGKKAGPARPAQAGAGSRKRRAAGAKPAKPRTRPAAAKRREFDIGDILAERD